MPNIAAWRSSFEAASYPFVEGALRDALNQPIFPPGLLVDAQFVLPAYVTGDVQLTASRNSGIRIELTFSVGTTVIGTATALSGDINHSTVAVIAPSGLQVGTLVFGAQASRAKQLIPLGLREYTDLQLAIEPGNVFRFPTNVLNQIDTPAGSAFGKTALVEGAGIRLVKESVNLVRVDAVGDPEKVRDCCPAVGSPLKFINEAYPTPEGELTLNVEAYSEPTDETDPRQVLRIKAEAGKLTFSINT